jgi:hypothetical protein
MTITIRRTKSTVPLEQGPGDSYTPSTVSEEAARAYGVYLKRSTIPAVPSAEESHILSTPDVVAGFEQARGHLDAWTQSL